MVKNILRKHNFSHINVYGPLHIVQLLILKVTIIITQVTENGCKPPVYNAHTLQCDQVECSPPSSYGSINLRCLLALHLHIQYINAKLRREAHLGCEMCAKEYKNSSKGHEPNKPNCLQKFFFFIKKFFYLQKTKTSIITC